MKRNQSKRDRFSRAPVIARTPYREIKRGFVRERNGQIYFVRTPAHQAIRYFVFHNGTISRKEETRDRGCLLRDQLVDVVRQKDLGITEIRWDETGW